MDVIPLTLVISLLLSLTFIALFLREFTRPRRAGAEHDSLLPLASEGSVLSAAPAPAPAAEPDHVFSHDHTHSHPDEVCASKRTDGKCCSSCQRRKDRMRAADGPKS